MSILRDILKEATILRAGRDDMDAIGEILASLSDSDRELWQMEAEYDFENRSEYFAKYGEAEFKQRLEADIVRLFES